MPEESKISKTLSDKTTRTVIVLVLVLLFLLALCNVDTYSETDIIHHAGIIHLKSIYDLGPTQYPAYKAAYETFVTKTTEIDEEFPLIYLHIADPNTKDGLYPVITNDEDLVNIEFGGIKLSDLRAGEFSSVS